MKKRVDKLLAEIGLFKSQDEAMRAIMAGTVYNQKTQERIEHAGMQVKEGTITFEIKGKQHPFVSRGGIKLAHAIEFFSIDFTDTTVLDIGSSTGGFTDCALQNGAKFVYALDVGTNQLAWKLRSHARVAVLEQLNFRDATNNHFEQDIDIIVTDVSFISLKVILQHVYQLFKDTSFQMVALIKPQFEVKKDEVGRNGIVTDEQLRKGVVSNIEKYILELGFEVVGVTQSPITGTKGNVEYLIYFKNHVDKQEK